MWAQVILALWLAAVPPATELDCLSCHGAEGMTSESGASVYVDPGKFKQSVHGEFTCTTCHTSVKAFPHAKPVPKVDCSMCHADVIREFDQSVHGTARKNGTPDTPTCQACHGPIHEVLPHTNAASRVAKKNLPDTCGACHANPAFLARHNIPFAKPVEAYRLSVHGRAVERGNEAAPSCSDCHGSHTIVPARDPRSSINHWKVADTCGKCHADIRTTYIQSVHGQAMLAGVRDAPVCTDCHGEHLILAPSEPQSLVNPARVSTATCGRCHADERLEQRYNLPADKVPTFEDSYHGLALRSGSQTVANCASCHGVHNIFPSDDPRSTINRANLAQTCGKCHAGAGTRFAIGPVHVRPASPVEKPVVAWIRLFYLGVIPLTLGFMLLHNTLDLLAKIIRGHRPHPVSGPEDELVRMNLHFRIAHWLVILSFPVLVVTGFALKFPDAWWTAPILAWESRFALRGTIHRVAAVVLILAMLYHVVHLILSRRDRRILGAMIPKVSDVTEFWAVLRYNLGLTRERARFGKFSYVEKLEYWAFFWGMAVMTVSGLLLWFNDFTLRNFPKWLADAATAVHFYEAVLATLSILVWHFYFAIFDPDVYPMDRAWLTGRLPAEHLREVRPTYYALLVKEQRPAIPGEPKPAEVPAEIAAEVPPTTASAETPAASDEKAKAPTPSPSPPKA